VEPIVLDSIAFNIDRESLARRLRVSPERDPWPELMALVEHAETIGRPKALYGMACVDGHGDDYLVVDGERLTSRVLRVNVGDAHRAFPYIATCGVELEAWGEGLADMLQSYWSEAIREVALRAATAALMEHLNATFAPGRTSVMNPGSLADWPLREQRPLFRVLGDTEALVGVRLLPSHLMAPSKTVSGIHFATEESFESCMLCPRADCPGRRSPYDAQLYETRYRQRQ
jgi:hypothetical protein